MANENEAREKGARAERLAAALRANLRRRKSQARARDAGSGSHTGDGVGQGAPADESKA